MFERQSYSEVHPDTLTKLDGWACFGLLNDLFLEAVLTNDLGLALDRADMFEMTTLQSICRYIRSELPERCAGSRVHLNQWMLAVNQSTRMAVRDHHPIMKLSRFNDQDVTDRLVSDG